jgi:phosphate-selective porin OprO/OprP
MLRHGLLLFCVLALAGPALGDDADDLRRSIATLESQLQAQEARLAELETERANHEEAYRENLLEILGEMEMDRQPNDLRLYWQDGIRMDSADGNVRLKFGGRLQYDFGWIDGGGLEPVLGDLEDGADVRRARLYMSGTMYHDMAFKLQFDVADGDADLKDAYLRFQNIPLIGNITAGHFKEPFSLDELTSSRYITFMERGLPNAMVPGRNVGIMASNHIFDQRMTWAAGVFYEVDDYGESNQDGGYNFTTRVTGVPIYENDGRDVLHLGASYSLRTPRDGLRYRSRPEAHFVSQRFTDTGTFDADRVNLFGFEAAWVHGPLSVQGEYVGSSVTGSTDTDSQFFNSFYVQTSYFLTGEHRPYSRKSGTFGRVRPNRNFRQDGGWGAVELAARYSYLDLRGSDLPDSARQLQDLTFGVNWYLNPNMRVSANYIHSMLDGDDVTGDTDLFMLRFQVDF